jgi:hypothetical protein
LGELFYYKELNKLLKTKDSNGKRLIDMMDRDDLRAAICCKEAVINA